MSPKAVVFDLDDTLYLEGDFVRSGFCAVGEWFRCKFGMPDFAQRADSAFLAGKRRNIFDGVLVSYGMVPESTIVERLVSTYRGHVPSIELIEDSRNCLDALRGNYPMALLTDGSSLTQRNKISTLGIEAGSDLVIVTGELGAGYSKPNPKAFRMVEDRLGLHGTELIYIGDNPRRDFLAPRSGEANGPRGAKGRYLCRCGRQGRRRLSIADLSPLQGMLSARCGPIQCE